VETPPDAPAVARTWQQVGQGAAADALLIINLADAVLPGREVTVEIDAFCGKLVIVVPAGAHVLDEGGALFSKRAVYGRDTAGADGPVIRLAGDARFSKVTVFRGRTDRFTAWQQDIPQWIGQR
jgi:hypothetical protein